MNLMILMTSVESLSTIINTRIQNPYTLAKSRTPPLTHFKMSSVVKAENAMVLQVTNDPRLPGGEKQVHTPAL